MSLLLVLSGAGVQAPPPPPPPPPPPLEHACAYCAEDGTTIYVTEDASDFYVPEDTDALCPQLAGGGWPDTLRRKRPREALERLLKLQKDATFGRKWFAEFETAQRQFVRADARAAIQVAAKEAREAAELIDAQVREEEFSDALREVALTLEVTREVKQFKDILEAANNAQKMAAVLRVHIQGLAIEEEEDELAILLLAD